MWTFSTLSHVVAELHRGYKRTSHLIPDGALVWIKFASGLVSANRLAASPPADAT
jgi:hypothetical protein